MAVLAVTAWVVAGCGDNTGAQQASAADDAADSVSADPVPYEAAMSQAAEGGQVVLLEFTGSDWCPPCIALENEVLSQSAFARAIEERALLVKLDFPRDRTKLPEAERRRNFQLQERYGVQAYPTVVIVNAEGEELAREVGYNGGTQESWLSWLEGALAGES